MGTYTKQVNPQSVNILLYTPEQGSNTSEYSAYADVMYFNSDGTTNRQTLLSELNNAQTEHIKNNTLISVNDGVNTSAYVSPSLYKLYTGMVALKLSDPEVDLAVQVSDNPVTTLVDIFGTQLYDDLLLLQ